MGTVPDTAKGHSGRLGRIIVTAGVVAQSASSDVLQNPCLAFPERDNTDHDR